MYHNLVLLNELSKNIVIKSELGKFTSEISINLDSQFFLNKFGFDLSFWRR